MNLDAFIRARESSWRRLDSLTAAGKGRPERLGPDGVLELGRLYRSATADLALARRRWPGDPVTARLEASVGAARPLVYRSERRTLGVLDFFASGYWRRVYERPRLLAVAAILLFGPGLLSFLWALRDPAAASGVLGGFFSQPPSGVQACPDPSLSLAEQAVFSSAIFTNNIAVTFRAFAGGVTAGLFTAYVLLYNGLVIGVVLGLVTEVGCGRALVGLIVPHGVLELSCIVVAAAAGLRIGSAIVVPRDRPRLDVFVTEARAAVEIVLGTAVWLVVAGLIEGFFTPRRMSLGLDLAVGFGVAAVFWFFVVARGATSDRAP